MLQTNSLILRAIAGPSLQQTPPTIWLLGIPPLVRRFWRRVQFDPIFNISYSIKYRSTQSDRARPSIVHGTDF